MKEGYKEEESRQGSSAGRNNGTDLCHLEILFALGKGFGRFIQSVHLELFVAKVNIDAGHIGAGLVGKDPKEIPTDCFTVAAKEST